VDAFGGQKKKFHIKCNQFIYRATALDGLPPHTEFYAMLSVKNA
jgi:hypothetical protein